MGSPKQAARLREIVQDTGDSFADALWSQLRLEAEEAFATAPMPAPLFLGSIINQPDFETAMFHRIADRLKNDVISRPLILEAFHRAAAATPEIALGLSADIAASLAILGLCCVQDTPARWVAIHRRHHEHADEQPDPHSPLAGFLWAHLGWMIFKNRELTRVRLVSRYAKDVMRDPFYAKLEQNFRWVRVVLISWLGFFASAFLLELVLRGSVLGAIQFGLSVLIWGVFVRTILVWHITWSVNSVTHMWGYRNYETDESSRNNLIIGFLSNGEGWHNNHHAAPRSARFGHRWWELDTTWLTIRLFSALGLARKIVTSYPSLAITRDMDRHGV